LGTNSFLQKLRGTSEYFEGIYMTRSRTLVKAVPLIVFLALAIGMVSTPAFADKVEFGDNNILQGTVTTFEKGTLIFSTAYAAKVKIPFAQIKNISTDKAVTLKMTNESILTGKLTTLDDGQVAIILDLVGQTVPFKWEQVKNINEPPGSWTGSFAAGGTVQTGNVERTSVSVAFDARRDWEHDRFQFRFLHNYAEDTGSITSRNTFGSLKFDHFFTEDFFTALSLELLKDEFKNLNLRAIIGLGLGYRIWNDDVKTLELEAGMTFFSEDVDPVLVAGVIVDDLDDQFISGRVGMTYSYKLLANLLFKDYLLYYPNLEFPKEYRLRNEASLISQLGKGWSLKLTHIFDQNSDAVPTVEGKDQQFIFALQYSF
jgi:putative salt-induced outer membrane protein YdiY